MERIALKKIERKLDKFEKKAGKAWDKVAAGLDDLNDDQGQQQQQAAAPLVVSAYDGGSAVWMVLADRTVRAHPGESSSKLGTISTGTRVHVLESATKDSRGKQRLKVHGGGHAVRARVLRSSAEHRGDSLQGATECFKAAGSRVEG